MFVNTDMTSSLNIIANNWKEQTHPQTTKLWTVPSSPLQTVQQCIKKGVLREAVYGTVYIHFFSLFLFADFVFTVVRKTLQIPLIDSRTCFYYYSSNIFARWRLIVFFFLVQMDSSCDSNLDIRKIWCSQNNYYTENNIMYVFTKHVHTVNKILSVFDLTS